MNDMLVRPADIGAARTVRDRQLEPSTANEPTSFGHLLKESIDAVDKMQEEGDQAAQKLLAGESQDIHGTMIAMQKASISMNLMIEVRNKVISAYEEIKRMQF